MPNVNWPGNLSSGELECCPSREREYPGDLAPVGREALPASDVAAYGSRLKRRARQERRERGSPDEFSGHVAEDLP